MHMHSEVHSVSVDFINLPEMYVKELQTGLCDGKAVPVIVKETPATAYVNGNNGIGPVSSSHFSSCLSTVTMYWKLTNYGTH